VSGARGGRAFQLAYLWHELRHRWRQTLIAAAGLAVGIGLVMTVSAAATGVDDAESTVLHSLYGVGTDVSVTKAAPNPGEPDPKNMNASGSSGKGIGYSPGKEPLPVDQLTPAPGLSWLPLSATARAARLPGVAEVAGGLTLSDTHFVVPSLSQIGPDGKPPASAFPTTLLVDGVDVAHPALGPFASVKVVSGRGFAPTDAGADVAVVDSGYAATHQLTVGFSITVEFHEFTIVGLVTQPPGSADVSIPLARAQALAKASPTSPYTGMTSPDMVTDVYVKAMSASEVAGVRSELVRMLPAATVSSSADLAGQVSGSLRSASRLVSDLGRWLAAGTLVSAFVLASLLTLAAVARRRRELGTLRALGWSRRRVIAQIMAESLVAGIIGAAFGIAVGFGGAAVLAGITPRLSATVANSPGNAAPKNVGINAGGMHVTDAPGSLHTLAARMDAPVSLSVIALAVAMALAGGLIAGLAGSWRASRMQPASAMSSLD
jgi:putative ABC transport system permease protein